MPVFHTKTIESILEPVAQQVRSLLRNTAHVELYFRYIHRNIISNVISSMCENLDILIKREEVIFVVSVIFLSICYYRK